MPSGTGKTISLLALITSFLGSNPDFKGKLIYCTRTVPEMEKVYFFVAITNFQTLEELKNLIQYRVKMLGENAGKLVAMGLSSRKNLCVNPKVASEFNGSVVDSKCRNMTSSWIREEAQDNKHIELCEYYENFEAKGMTAIIPNGVYTLGDMKKYLLTSAHIQLDWAKNWDGVHIIWHVEQWNMPI